MTLCMFVCIWCSHTSLSASNEEEFRLESFYDRISKTDVKYCKDRTKLLPGCDECIPGLQKGTSSSGDKECNEYISESKTIRDEIAKLTHERYGKEINPKKPYGLYPYLELPDFMTRQLAFGEMISNRQSKNIIDIGSYYNPIHLFFNSNHCPESVVIIEPILDALSVMIPCISDPNKMTHVIFMPITFKYFITVKTVVPKPDSVVCIGCDSHYGPNKFMLETTFDRPYTLFMEYPSEYIHNKHTFKHMNGEGEGEKLLFMRKFKPDTNLTQYTQRIMKVIDYVPINKV